MNRKKGRPGIKPHIRQLIYSKALETKTPRFALAVELTNLIEKMDEIPPAEETIMRLISEARNHPNSPLDKPWSVVTLGEYEIPPEALPPVLKMAIHFRQKEKRPMTIREARWAARLSSLHDLRKLSLLIQEYAYAEKVVEIMNKTYELEYVIDDELYKDLTGKFPNEPVFDEDGREIPSKGETYVRQGLNQLRHAEPVDQKKQKGVHHEGPHRKEG